MMKYFVSLLAILISCAQADIKRPNIVLVMADDQGWGDTGYNGHPFVQTPTLDAMSKAGLKLDRFYSASPVCSPTRASVLSGRNPMRSKVLNHGHYIRAEEETLAELYQKAGYATGHFGKWHIGSVQKQSPVCPGNMGFDEWLTAPNFFDIDPWLSEKGQAKQFKGVSSEIVVEHSLKFIEKQVKADKSFFTVVWFSAPHSPHKVLAPENKLYEGKPSRAYFQEITEMDRTIGVLRDGIKELGVRDNTIVWFCSDNGGLVKESSGGRERKGSIYEGGLRVPSVIEWPNGIKPRSTSFPSFTSDMFPTLLDVCGIKRETNHPLDGITLKDLFQKEMSVRPGMAFWHHFTKGQSTFSDRIVKEIHDAQKKGVDIAIPVRIKKDIDQFPQYTKDSYEGHSAYLDWPWKLHYIKKKGAIHLELYHLENDPMESKDLSMTQIEKTETLNKKLQNWHTSVFHSLNGHDY